jgi:hypothetical protein
MKFTSQFEHLQLQLFVVLFVLDFVLFSIVFDKGIDNRARQLSTLEAR